MKCEKCGAEAKEYREGHTRGWICNICGWGCVTSYYEPYETDQTVYSIIVFENKLNTENIRIISKITGENYLNARELLLLPESVIFEGKATEILKFKQSLCDSGISFRITPDFPY